MIFDRLNETFGRFLPDSGHFLCESFHRPSEVDSTIRREFANSIRYSTLTRAERRDTSSSSRRDQRRRQLTLQQKSMQREVHGYDMIDSFSLQSKRKTSLESRPLEIGSIAGTRVFICL